MADNSENRINKIVKRFEMLKSRRGLLDTHLEDISRVMSPRRQGFVSDPQEGDRRNDEIFDGTGMQAKRSLANTLGAMIRPEGEFFARIKTEDDRLERDEQAAMWLEDASERMDAAIRNPRARLRQAAGEVDEDLVALGTGVMFIGRSNKNSHLLFQSLYLGMTYPMWDDEGNVAGMFRLKVFRLWQAIDKFGKANLSQKSKELIAEGKIDEKIEVLHVVLERDQMAVSGGVFAINMPWSSMWIEKRENHIIEEGGFHEFPFIAPRWDTTSGEDYGRSPGMVALPDVNTSQAMQETMLVAGQRNTDPPIMAPSDGSFEALNTFPGGISYYDPETAALVGGNPFFPLASGANLPLTRDMQQDTREMILAAFFKNILNLPVNGPQMTATEIIQRKDEFIREVGSVFGRLEADYNRPIAERSFNIMMRAGSFLPVPEVLQGANIKFEFELPVTKIRKQIKAAAGEEWARGVFEMAAIRPEAANIVDVDALARFSHEALGLPNEIINSEEKIADIRAQDAEQRAQQEELAGLEQAAGIADKVGGALKKANLTQEQEAAPAV